MGFSWTGRKVSVDKHDDGKYYIIELSSGHTIEMESKHQRSADIFMEHELEAYEIEYYECYFGDIVI